MAPKYYLTYIFSDTKKPDTGIICSEGQAGNDARTWWVCSTKLLIKLPIESCFNEGYVILVKIQQRTMIVMGNKWESVVSIGVFLSHFCSFSSNGVYQ